MRESERRLYFDTSALLPYYREEPKEAREKTSGNAYNFSNATFNDSNLNLESDLDNVEQTILKPT